MAASACRTEMEKFSGGTALLPWTRQVLAVLWDHLRLLLQVIYYTCMSGKNNLELIYYTFMSGMCNVRVLKLGSGSIVWQLDHFKQKLDICTNLIWIKLSPRQQKHRFWFVMIQKKKSHILFFFSLLDHD